MSAALPDYYAVDWWKIVEVVETTHEVYVAGQTFYVVTVTESDSTISNLVFDETFVQDGWKGLLSFDITGPPATTSFCNITIPKSLTRVGKGESWLIKVDGVETSYDVGENATHTWLYFTYPHSVHIEISGTWAVPEFQTTLLQPLLIALILAAVVALILATVVLRKKLRSPRPKSV